MCNLLADVQRQGARDRVRRVDPAIQIEHIVRHVICVNAVDRVADVLPRRDDHREREQDHRTDAPVKAKH